MPSTAIERPDSATGWRVGIEATASIVDGFDVDALIDEILGPSSALAQGASQTGGPQRLHHHAAASASYTTALRSAQVRIATFPHGNSDTNLGRVLGFHQLSTRNLFRTRPRAGWGTYFGRVASPQQFGNTNTFANLY